jgi:hypothetical protein
MMVESYNGAADDLECSWWVGAGVSCERCAAAQPSFLWRQHDEASRFAIHSRRASTRIKRRRPIEKLGMLPAASSA